MVDIKVEIIDYGAQSKYLVLDGDARVDGKRQSVYRDELPGFLRRLIVQEIMFHIIAPKDRYTLKLTPKEHEKVVQWALCKAGK